MMTMPLMARVSSNVIFCNRDFFYVFQLFIFRLSLRAIRNSAFLIFIVIVIVSGLLGSLVIFMVR